jgi:hypothetical protein
MENYNGQIGSITVGVLKAGLKPTTTMALIVKLRVIPAEIQLILLPGSR